MKKLFIAAILFVALFGIVDLIETYESQAAIEAADDAAWGIVRK